VTIGRVFLPRGECAINGITARQIREPSTIVEFSGSSLSRNLARQTASTESAEKPVERPVQNEKELARMRRFERFAQTRGRILASVWLDCFYLDSDPIRSSTICAVAQDILQFPHPPIDKNGEMMGGLILA
jgi:hypothetical protein